MYIVTGSNDTSVKVWVYPELTVIQIINDHDSYVNSVAISMDNTYIISGSNDKTIKVWNLHNRKIEFELKGHIGFVNSVILSKDEKYN